MSIVRDPDDINIEVGPDFVKVHDTVGDEITGVSRFFMQTHFSRLS